MTLVELEQVILEYMRKIYDKEYIGKIKVENIYGDFREPIGYKVILGLNNEEKPLVIAKEGSEKDLLKTIYEELRFRNLVEVEYFEGKQYEQE